MHRRPSRAEERAARGNDEFMMLGLYLVQKVFRDSFIKLQSGILGRDGGIGYKKILGDHNNE